MTHTARDFVSVDMRGLKAPLIERARAKRVPVSALVRLAVAREIGLEQPGQLREPMREDELSNPLVKVSIRLSAAEALQLAERAREADLSRSAYVGGLIGGATLLSTRADHVGALTASCAELATLSRNVYHLATLLAAGSVQGAMEYAGTLHSLRSEVRRHLAVAAAALAHLRPKHARPRRRPDGEEPRNA
jgi:post-segregation antitoxin (ccd killing protein)